MKTRQVRPFGLRMPEDLKRDLRTAAARDGRSMNAQIVQHLLAIYQPEKIQDFSEGDQATEELP